MINESMPRWQADVRPSVGSAARSSHSGHFRLSGWMSAQKPGIGGLVNPP
jgi:hypothetical protein